MRQYGADRVAVRIFTRIEDYLANKHTPTLKCIPKQPAVRVRTHNQYATVATMWTAAMKLVAERS